MFYELYRDVNVTSGGVWVDPDTMDFIQVTDMDSAVGEEGVTLVEKGGSFADEETVKGGLRSAGFFEVDKPPAPPRTRKHWDPRPWKPHPKPGYLFWLPKVPEGYRILEAWKRWNELDDAGEKFESLPEDLKLDVLIALEASFGYSGFDGSPGESVAVIEKGTAGVKERHKWGEAVVSKNPERAVWKILKEMGVENNG